MKTLVAFAFVILAMTTYAQSTQKTVTTSIPSSVTHWVTLTGNDLYPTCLAWEKTQNNNGEGEADTVIKGQTCYSFILGVINAYPASSSASFPKGTTNEQIVDVVVNYLKEHPADRGKDAWYLILKSEEEAFHIQWLLL